jgi:hypothetical protein
MPGLSASELSIVVFLLLLVSIAGRLPRWGEALGSYLYKRSNPAPAEASRLPSTPPSQVPPPR